MLRDAEGSFAGHAGGRGLQDPPRSSKAPRAQLGAAVGLGRDAFTALQVFRVGGDTTDEVTVVVRDRNVLIIVTMQGQQHGGGFWAGAGGHAAGRGARGARGGSLN